MVQDDFQPSNFQLVIIIAILLERGPIDTHG